MKRQTSMTIRKEWGNKYNSFMDDIEEMVSAELLIKKYPLDKDDRLGTQVYTGKNSFLQIIEGEDGTGQYHEIRMLTGTKTKDTQRLEFLIKKHQ